MIQLLKNMKKSQVALDLEIEKVLCGNKSAAARARKITLELDKLHKQFRKMTLDK